MAVLASLNLGASAAENEMQDLGDYHLETDEYRRALRGEAQVIAGRKGSGNTALFVQLRDKLRRRELAKEYQEDAFVAEGDFADRILKLTQRIVDDFERAIGASRGEDNT